MKNRRGFAAALCCVALVGCGGEPAWTDVEAGENFGAEPLASSQAALLENSLSKAEERTVLQLIDNICGDTWCEGDHDFRFDRVRCKDACGAAQGTCTLTLRLFPHDSDIETGPTWTRVCKTPGFGDFASLVETSSNGYQSLNWGYYEALSECINRLEGDLRGD